MKKTLITVLFFITVSVLAQTVTYPEFTVIKPKVLVSTGMALPEGEMAPEVAAASTGEVAVTCLYLDDPEIQIAFLNQELEEVKFINIGTGKGTDTKITANGLNRFGHFYKLEENDNLHELYFSLYSSAGVELSNLKITSAEKIEGLEVVPSENNGFDLFWCEYMSNQAYEIKHQRLDSLGNLTGDTESLTTGTNYIIPILRNPVGLEVYKTSDDYYNIAVYKLMYSTNEKRYGQGVFRVMNGQVDSLIIGEHIDWEVFDLLPREDGGLYLTYKKELDGKWGLVVEEYDSELAKTDSAVTETGNSLESYSRLLLKNDSEGKPFVTYSYKTETGDQYTVTGTLDENLKISETTEYSGFYATEMIVKPETVLFYNNLSSVISLSKISNVGGIQISNKVVNNYKGSPLMTSPSVSSNNEDLTAVSWTTEISGTKNIYLKYFDASGEPVTDDIDVATGYKSKTAMNNNGDVIVLWQETSTANELKYRLYNSSGEKIGEDMNPAADHLGSGYSSYGVKFIDDDKFYIYWNGANSCFRLFSLSEAPLTDVIEVNDDFFAEIEITEAPDGILWVYYVEVVDLMNEEYRLVIEKYNTEGESVGNVNLNLVSGKSSYWPDIKVNNDGSYILVWNTLKNHVESVNFSLYNQENESIKNTTVTSGNLLMVSKPDLLIKGNELILPWVSPQQLNVSVMDSEGSVYPEEYTVGNGKMMESVSGEIVDGKINLVWEDGGEVNYMILDYEIVTDVEEPNSPVSEYNLAANYPNPFNPSTNIEFSLVEKSKVTLSVYDILGREVATLVNGELAGGIHKVNFNGSALSSGIYLYRIDVTGVNGALRHSDVKKMMLLK